MQCYGIDLMCYKFLKVTNRKVENVTGKYIKKFRTDNSKEYMSKEFNNFLKEEGITRVKC